MKTSQKVDNIAVIVGTILGLVFFSMASLAFQNLDVKCPSFTIRNGWVLIQVLGACMAMGGISFFFCTLRENKCYDGDINRAIEVYFVLFGILGLIMLGICIVMILEYSKLRTLSDCDNKNKMGKKSVIFISAISGLIVIFSIAFFVKVRMEEK